MPTYILDVDCADPDTLLGDDVTRRFTVFAEEAQCAEAAARAMALAVGLLPLKVRGL